MDMFSGQVLGYRMFDLGYEVNLNEAQKVLRSATYFDKFTFQKIIKSVVIADKPLIFDLEDLELDIGGRKYHTSIVAKLWGFGALSLCFRIDLTSPTSDSQLIQIALSLNDSELLDRLAFEKASDVIQELDIAIKKPDLWSQSEDYMIFVQNIADPKTAAARVKNLVDGEFLYQLLAFEPTHELSNQMKAPMRSNTLQYSNSDLVAIDWDSSYVISSEDTQDICDVIEFANIQLLELRFFDDSLDKKINQLFKELMLTSPKLFSNAFTKLNREATRVYLETLEVIERVDNSLKVVGDIYYARIYRQALARLRTNEWRANIDQKLQTVIEICNMNRSEIDGKKSHILEIIIIILIAIEVIPFVYNMIN